MSMKGFVAGIFNIRTRIITPEKNNDFVFWKTNATNTIDSVRKISAKI
jgi:hypothetical protein